MLSYIGSMNNLDKIQISRIRDIISQMMPFVESAEAKFRSAKNWGFFDILGGGFIVDMIKHSKLNSARNDLDRINYFLQCLKNEMQQNVSSTDFSMNMSGFAMFADFVFDGVFADLYMQSKIVSSLNQLQDLKNRLLMLDREMCRLAAM